MNKLIPKLYEKEYLKYIEMNFDIDFCSISEYNKLIEFINTYWKKDHIFTKSKILLDYQHLDKKENRYNFVLCKDATGEILSILGFVPTRKYDENIENLCVWPCIWKTKPDVNIKGIGIVLYKYLIDSLNIETMPMFGLSEQAKSIYSSWDFETGTANHYYLKSAFKKKFSILEDKNNNYTSVISGENKLKRISEIEFRKIYQESFSTRYKTKYYYINRYFNHPIYNYTVFLIATGSTVQGFLFTRICEANQSRCMRIIDFCGNEKSLSGLYFQFQTILIKYDCEYIDFINIGIRKEILESSGFIERHDTQSIVPNYFEPYLQENIEMYYAFKTINQPVKKSFFKGDADQDRPNQL